MPADVHSSAPPPDQDLPADLADELARRGVDALDEV
jgi:hypothetical protein